MGDDDDRVVGDVGTSFIANEEEEEEEEKKEGCGEEDPSKGVGDGGSEGGGSDGWEAARVWLASLPKRRNVMWEEVDAWLQSNKHQLPRHIITMPRGPLFRYLVSQHKLMRRAEQGEKVELVEPPVARFKRSDKWRPVYTWLESLDTTHVVGTKSIDEWLTENPALKSELQSKHSRHHLFHYIQKCHAGIIKKREKQCVDGIEKESRKTCKMPKEQLASGEGSGLQMSSHTSIMDKLDNRQRFITTANPLMSSHTVTVDQLDNRQRFITIANPIQVKQPFESQVKAEHNVLPSYYKDQTGAFLQDGILSDEATIALQMKEKEEGTMVGSSQEKKAESMEPSPPLFKRSDKWRPVYTWLESLNTEHVVGAKSIDEWLAKNPALKSELESKHSRHHLFHYIQKCHTGIIKKREKQRMDSIEKERNKPFKMPKEQPIADVSGLQVPARTSVEDQLDGRQRFIMAANLIHEKQPSDIQAKEEHTVLPSLHESQIGGFAQEEIVSNEATVALQMKEREQETTIQSSEEKVKLVEPPAPPFKRSDKWRPVYAWLESLNVRHVVGAKSIDEWLAKNPDLKSELESKHSRHHLFHYIQKCHGGLIKKREKQRLGGVEVKRKLKSSINHAQNKDSQASNMQLMVFKQIPAKQSLKDHIRGSNLDKSEARRRYEILTELQSDLSRVIAYSQERMKREVKHDNLLVDMAGTSAEPFPFLQNNEFQNGPGSLGNASRGLMNGLASLQSEDYERRTRRRLRNSDHTQENCASLPGQLWSRKKRKKGKENMQNLVPFWSYTEVPLGGLTQCHSAYNMVRCLEERQRGAGVGPMPHLFKMVGVRSAQRWKPYLEGWNSLGKQFIGAASLLQQKAYSAWLPCWSAYTSSVAVAAPLGMMDQGVQKVLDVRFHPQGLPQLVCSSNAAPNELLLYNLESGRTTELAGHNCQIQAVEYAANSLRIVSCGKNLLKIWDSISGTCLHTLGPRPGFENSDGHKKKINAMAVNTAQSCIVATSGGEGDNQLLLWNIMTGELVHDLNSNLRESHDILPCMDAMEFCNQNLLICGSDSTSGGPAVVQLWDADAAQPCSSFPAHDSYITCLKTDPSGKILMTGAGDGTVALFDIRSCGGIARLPLGSCYEITSVSFSSCGTYFQASSTSNSILVWDTRMLPMDPGPMPSGSPLESLYGPSCKLKALHRLSHGTPMPTSNNAGQLPGFVDEGDQGVNDARWFHNVALLVTVSGNGSIAMWDVALGKPCVRHLISHSRCINTVAIAPNDKYICSGGDDQKVMLYQRKGEKVTSSWRLTHPLCDDLPE